MKRYLLLSLLATFFLPIHTWAHDPVWRTTNFRIELGDLPCDRISGGGIDWIQQDPGRPNGGGGASPQGLDARKGANESSAISTLRTLVTTQSLFVEREHRGTPDWEEIVISGESVDVRIFPKVDATDKSSVSYLDCKPLHLETISQILPNGRTIEVERMTLLPSKVHFGEGHASRSLSIKTCFGTSRAILRGSFGESSVEQTSVQRIASSSDPQLRDKVEAVLFTSPGERVIGAPFLNRILAAVDGGMTQIDPPSLQLDVGPAGSTEPPVRTFNLIDTFPVHFEMLNVETGDGGSVLHWTLEVRVNRWEAS